MQKKKNFQLAVIGVLAFAVLFMSVGFAAYSQTLNINGTTHVAANKWSVHFVSDANAEGYFQRAAGSVTETSKTVSDTAVTYEVTLSKPGDFFAFNIDVINDGDFNATLKTITMTALTEAQQKYLTYTFTYDGLDYTSTATDLSIGLPYATGSNRKATAVKVQYVQPQNASDLPTEQVNLTLSVALDYQQAQ